VFGLELGRRYALRDEEGFSQVFTEANRFLGVQAAVAAVVLLVMGRELFALWTGRDGLFDVAMLALAILPPILLPGMILSMEALGYAERQWTIVRVRLVQAAVTVALFLCLPIAEAGLRMMAALAVGEIAGLGIPLLWAMRSVDRRLSLRQQIAAGGWVVCAAVVTAVLLSPTLLIPQSAPFLRLLAGAGLGGIALLFVLLFFGLSSARRRGIIAMVGRRLMPAGR
jgi:O-antigen/teichoic acid export membrane protein